MFHSDHYWVLQHMVKVLTHKVGIGLSLLSQNLQSLVLNKKNKKGTRKSKVEF